jgi:hypothetical protein
VQVVTSRLVPRAEASQILATDLNLEGSGVPGLDIDLSIGLKLSREAWLTHLLVNGSAVHVNLQ